MSKKICVVILARGGSKSIKRKNMKLLDGKPLIYYPIAAALGSKCLGDDPASNVFLSSDDDEILETASLFGAIPVKRPDSISGDFSLDIEAMKHFLGMRKDYDVIVHLRPTFPSITSDIVDRAVTDFMESYEMYDSLRSVIRASESPYKMWDLEYSGGYTRIVPAFVHDSLPESHCAPRQLLPTFYWQNAAIDIVKSWVVTEMNSMTGNRVLPFFMSKEHCIDIDDEDDLAAARKSIRKGE